LSRSRVGLQPLDDAKNSKEASIFPPSRGSFPRALALDEAKSAIENDRELCFANISGAQTVRFLIFRAFLDSSRVCLATHMVSNCANSGT
jgi:hypothetical protein